MRIGIIDLGTNSIRFDIHEIISRKRHHRLFREKLMIRLGEGVFLNGKLNKFATERCVIALKGFAEKCAGLGVQKIIAVGTSALRDAADGQVFVQRVKRETGIRVRIISGEEEALLIAEGVLHHERKLSGKFALVDIGGGSTEITICDGREILYTASFNLGVARLQQLFLKGSPPRSSIPGQDPILVLREHIRQTLLQKGKTWPDVKKIVGSSGTVRALSRLQKGLKKERGTFTKKSLSKLVVELSPLTSAELMLRAKMEPKRVDLILAGGILLEEIAGFLGASRISTTSYSLRDGILDNILTGLNAKKKSKKRKLSPIRLAA